MRRGVLCRKLICAVMVLFSTAAAAGDAGYRLFREGYHFWRAENPAKAYSVFDSIHQDLPLINDLRLYATAATALASGRNHQATVIFNKLIAEYPSSPWSRAAEAKLAQVHVPPDPAAEPSLKKSDTETLEYYATALFRARDYKKAAPVLAELLRRKGGDDQQLLMTLASAYARSNRHDEAISLQRKVAALFPNETRRALYKVVFLQADRNHDKEAISAANAFLDRYPSSPESDNVMWLLAWSHFRLNSFSSAITYFESYRGLARARMQKLRADYWIARCLEKMGNKLGAAAAYGAIASQDSGGYYGHLASARQRHKAIVWQLPELKKKPGSLRLNMASPSALLAGLGLYEFMPVVGWNGSYRELIDTVAKAWGLNAPFVNAIIQVESHFNPNAVSPAGAVGLMQLIPPTAQQMCDELLLDVFVQKDLRDPIWNVTLGMGYLRKLSAMFSRHMVAMIASYNAGEQAVSRWMGVQSLADPEMFVEEIPYAETNAYVKKVLSLVW